MDSPQPISVTSSTVPAMSTIIVHGAGVISEQPVMETTPPPVRLVPPSPARRLFEGALLFFVVILFLRTIAVEPFGVPTGSMAPALAGNHKTVECPRCRFPVTVGEPSLNAQGYPVAFCSNCNYHDLGLNLAREVAGDRLLVDKTVFQVRNPRRWEVAVFICPSDKSKPYVKRVIGLPNEQIQIKDGDIWANGELVRKTMAQFRECRIPVYSGDHYPPAGWNRRWLPTGMIPRLTNANDPTPPWFKYRWEEVGVTAEDSATPRLAAYWHTDADSGQTEIIRDSFEYNGHASESSLNPVHDFGFRAEFEPTGGDGFLVCSMNDGADEVTAHILVGATNGESKLMIPEKGLVRTANKPPLPIGKKANLEMALVDRRFSLCINGIEYFSHDLPAGVKREDLSSPVKIGGQGINLTFRHMILERDIHYRSSGPNGTNQPLALGSDQYFMLGDNSANSDDSRSWQIPSVPRRNFLGKPFLLHQPSRPVVFSLGGKKVEMQSIDWKRIRWLR